MMSKTELGPPQTEATAAPTSLRAADRLDDTWSYFHLSRMRYKRDCPRAPLPTSATISLLVCVHGTGGMMILGHVVTRLWTLDISDTRAHEDCGLTDPSLAILI